MDSQFSIQQHLHSNSNVVFLSEKQKKKFSDLDVNLLLEQYLKNKQQNKGLICPFWRRGRCIFDRSVCQNAHGIDDLQYAPSVQQYENEEDSLCENIISDAQQQLQESSNFNNNGKISKTSWKSQNSFGYKIRATYRNLYDYQFTLLKQERIAQKGLLNQTDLDQNKKRIGELKQMMHIDHAEQFIDLLYKLYPDIIMTKSFLCKEFCRIGYKKKAQLVENKYVYTTKLKIPPLSLEGDRHLDAVYKMPRLESLEELILHRVVGIMRETQCMPVPISLICEEYYAKYSNFTEPSLHLFVRLKKQSLQEFLFAAESKIIQMVQLKAGQAAFITLEQEFQQKQKNVQQMQVQQTEFNQKSNSTNDGLTFVINKDQKYWLEKSLCLTNFGNIANIQNIMDNYQLKQGKGKRIYCNYWLKGICLFSQDQCFNAHGFDDFTYEKWDGESKINVIQQTTKFKMAKSYKILYEYQQTLIKNGKLQPSQLFTLEIIQQDPQVRSSLRHKLCITETEQLLSLLFSIYYPPLLHYDQVPLSRAFIEREFVRAGFLPKHLLQLQGLSWFEVKLVLPPNSSKRSTDVILQMPNLVTLQHNIEDEMCMVLEALISQNNKQNYPGQQQNLQYYKLSDIISQFYQRQKWNQPTLHIFLKRMNLTLEQFLERIRQHPKIQPLKLEDAVFVTSKHEFAILQNKILQSSMLFLEQNQLELQLSPLIDSSSHDEFVFNDVNNNKNNVSSSHIGLSYSSFKKVMKQSVLQKMHVLYITLPAMSIAESYILNTNFYHQFQIVQQQYLIKQMQVDILQILNELEQSKQQQDGVLFNSLAFQRVVIVDSQQSLEYARIILQRPDSNLVIGVDLEGNLAIDGRIDLIQIGVIIQPQLQKLDQNNSQNNRQVIVFDMQTIKDDKSLYPLTLTVLKTILESKQILKVFFDCRQDTLALQGVYEIHMQNVIDMSAVHSFIQQVRIYHKHLSQIDEAIIDADKIFQIIKEIEQSQNRFPGLNDILIEYNAEHGINELKSLMKENFKLQQSANQDYFMQRPIHPEFLEYSVKDVEDLVQVLFSAVQIFQHTYSSFLLNGMQNLPLEQQQAQCLEMFKCVSASYNQFANLQQNNILQNQQNQ